jgi:hypothetical protein
VTSTGCARDWDAYDPRLGSGGHTTASGSAGAGIGGSASASGASSTGAASGAGGASGTGGASDTGSTSSSSVAASSSGQAPVVDQYVVGSDGGILCSSAQSVTQTFTVGVSGKLAGIEVGPGIVNGKLLMHMTMSVIDPATGNQLGSAVTRTNTGFPHGYGTPPVQATLGVGYFDFASSGIPVMAGQHLAFTVTCPDAVSSACVAGVCVANTLTCNLNGDCREQLGLTTTGTAYPGGSTSVNGMTLANESLAFKTLVLP